MMDSLPAFALIGQNVRADADEAILSVRLNDAEAQFTDATLSELPQVTFSTTTLWTHREISFAGPPLQSVLETTGAMQDVAAPPKRRRPHWFRSKRCKSPTPPH